jgi:cobalamin biosynthesis protein CobD/CbiB
VRTAAACTLGKRKTLFLDGRRERAGDPPQNSRALIFRIPINRVNWTTSSFLIGTFVLTLTAVPLYLWHFGIDWFHLAVFAVLLAATGFSITLGYHRLFSHMVQVHYVGTGDNIMVDRVILDED